MKRLLPAIFVPALILSALASVPTPSYAAPALSLSTDEEIIIVRKPFSIQLSICWEGDAETYLVETPRLKLPEGITQSGSSYSTSAKDTTHSLCYRYTLSAAATGDYVLDPVEISYWEKNARDARTTRTEALRFTVSSRSEATLQQYRIPGMVLLIFISLIATLFVFSTKKKKADSVIEPHAKGGNNAE